ncbi:MAG: hypothetical protein H0U56_03670 [Methylibium sp.]|nr:hypothetical protein [Methylibium sp.]
MLTSTFDVALSHQFCSFSPRPPGAGAGSGVTGVPGAPALAISRLDSSMVACPARGT